MENYKKDRNIEEIPIHPSYQKEKNGFKKLYDKLNSMYFFKNQNELFDCYLILMNDKVYINYNIKNSISIDFMKFVRLTAPTNIKDKKRKFYKPTFLL